MAGRAILLAEAEEERLRKILNITRRWLRDQSDPMQLPEHEFIGNFRVSKDGFTQVLADIVPLLPPIQRRTAVPNELKLLSALSFYASGSYQRNAGCSYMMPMSQPTFSKCLHEVTDALNSREILLHYIQFPSTQIEKEEYMKGFMEKYGFPGIIGCIDGTHVAIVCPAEHEEAFLNRKFFHSLNVLIICDQHLNVLHIDASFGGRAHDSYVWNQSPIKAHLERALFQGQSCWLLGDSGYAQRPTMMTPIVGTAPGSPEEHYTNLHCRVRNTVERCIGVLKARWRCLLAQRVLYYEPEKAAKIVNACAVLHNIANAHNTPVPELPEADAEADRERQEEYLGRQGGEAEPTRERVVQRLWAASLMRP